jgi:hypothetical protein
MKRNYFYQMMAIVLLISTMLTSCGKDETVKYPSAPETVTLSLSEENASWVIISFSDVYLSYGYRIYRSETIDGEYEKVSTTAAYLDDADHSRIDESAEYNTTYFYKVAPLDLDSNPGETSEPVEITTGSPDSTAELDVEAVAEGEGMSAILKKNLLNWTVVSNEGIEKFIVKRDGVIIGEAPVNDFYLYYFYSDENVSFDVEYTYQVVAVTTEGIEFESNVVAYTATRPEVIDRPAPVVAYIEGVSGEQKVRIGVTRVEGDSQSTEYEIRSRIDGYTDWLSVDGMVSDFATDDSGNITTTFGYSEVSFTTGGAYFDAQARVFTAGQWSEWSSIETAFIIVGK